MLEQTPDKGIKSDNGVLQLTVSQGAHAGGRHRDQGLRPRGRPEENDDQLANLTDGKESTSWSTELYRSAAFGNLKDGVGLEFTLDAPATIIEIVSTVDGWKGELRQDTTSGSQAKIADLDGKNTDHHPAGAHLCGAHLVHHVDRADRQPLRRGAVGDPVLQVAHRDAGGDRTRSRVDPQIPQ